MHGKQSKKRGVKEIGEGKNRRTFTLCAMPHAFFQYNRGVMRGEIKKC
jgi:hypothetical protein